MKHIQQQYTATINKEYQVPGIMLPLTNGDAARIYNMLQYALATTDYYSENFQATREPTVPLAVPNKTTRGSIQQVMRDISQLLTENDGSTLEDLHW